MAARKAFLTWMALVCLVATALVGGTSKTTEPPANAYRGLLLEQATPAEVRAALGETPIRCESPDDLRYPAGEGAALNDRLYFRSGKLALVTAATPDARYPTKAEIIRKLGQPEANVRFVSQEYLDYTTQGLRFICDDAGLTTGIIHFGPTRRRVPEEEPAAHIDLRRAPDRRPAAKAPSDFRVGAAELSIAPEKLDDLSADAAQKPFHLAEDLLARVVIFSRQSQRIVFIGLDVFGMGPWDLDRLRESLARKGYPQVIVAMSHTHANVDTIGFYGYYPRDYARHVMRRAEEAVLLAAERMRECTSLTMGSAEMPLAGGRVADLVRNGRDPGLLDPTVSILQAMGRDNRPIANLIHMACHPEVIRLRNSRGLSPDYVGSLCREVGRELGGQTVFLNGVLGGMITPDARFGTQEAAVEMGRKLARFFVAAASDARPSSSYELSFYRRAVEYPIVGETVLTFLRKPPEPFDFHQERVRTEMNAIWIGDAQLITVPGELLPDIGLEIAAKMPGRTRMIVGLANGELGYLIPSFDFRAGGYEERTGPGAAGGPITRSVGLELATRAPESTPKTP
jgi:hypothetical protein